VLPDGMAAASTPVPPCKYDQKVVILSGLRRVDEKIHGLIGWLRQVKESTGFPGSVPKRIPQEDSESQRARSPTG